MPSDHGHIRQLSSTLRLLVLISTRAIPRWFIIPRHRRGVLGNYAFVYLTILSFLFGAAHGVPCFCTENRCTYGYCESPWCLVGIQHNGRVIRTCGSESSQQLQPCLQDVGEWQDVCACTTPYCNTFAFLRYEIRAQSGGTPQTPALDAAAAAAAAVVPNSNTPVKPLRPAQRPPPAPPIIHFDRKSTDEPNGSSSSGGSGSGGGARRSRKKGPHKDDPVIFERNDEKEGMSLRQSYLIIVLIVVPLAIAGTAVIVVIVGYYCKMC